MKERSFGNQDMFRTSQSPEAVQLTGQNLSGYARSMPDANSQPVDNLRRRQGFNVRAHGYPTRESVQNTVRGGESGPFREEVRSQDAYLRLMDQDFQDTFARDLPGLNDHIRQIRSLEGLEGARANLGHLIRTGAVDPFSADLGQTVEAINRVNTALTQRELLREQNAAGGGRGPEQRTYNPTDEALYSPHTPVHEKITARLLRMTKYKDVYDLQQRRVYFKELQRYVRVVLENSNINEFVDQATLDQINVKNPKGGLKLENVDNRNKLLEILKKSADQAEEGDLGDFAEQLKEQVKLSNFFIGLEGDPLSRQERAGDLPNNIDELMSLIMQTWSSFQTGQEHELIDGEGNVRIENFWYWMRERMMEWHEGNPFATNADYLTQNISVRTRFSSINLLEILLTPRFLQKQDIVLRGIDPAANASQDPNNPTSQRTVTALYTSPEMHPDFKNGRYKIMGEAWLAQMTHNYDAQYKLERSSDQKVTELMHAIGLQNNFTRDGNFFKAFMLPAAALKETENYVDYRDAGRVGQAIQKMTLMWYYLSEFTDLYGKEKAGEGMDNMFFKIAGLKGVNTIFKTIAADSLARSLEVRTKYKNYVLGMIGKEADQWRGNDDKSKIAQTVIRERIEKLKKDLDEKKQDGGVSINLDFLPELEQLKKDIYSKQNNGALPDEGTTKRFHKETETVFKSTIKSEFLQNLGVLRYAADEKRGDDTIKVIKTVDLNSFSTDDDPAKAWEGNRKFAEALFQKFVGGTWGDLNVFNNVKKDEKYFKIMESAIQQGGAEGLGLSDQDKKYAAYWAGTLRNWTGIAARNDTVGIGFDAWAKLMNFKNYRHRAFEGRTGGGSLDNLPGVRSLSLTLFDGLKVTDPRTDIENQDLERIAAIDDEKERSKALKAFEEKRQHSFLEVLQAGVGSHPQVGKTDADGKPDSRFKVKMGEFEGQALAQFSDIHLANAFKMMNLLMDQIDIHLDSLVSEDKYGNLIFDQKKAQEMMGTWWKTIRYAYDQYDIPYDQIMYYQGREMKMRDYFFNKEVQRMGMYQRKIDKSQKPGTETNMGRNLFAYLIAKEIFEHTRFKRNKPLWNIYTVKMIQSFFERMSRDISDHPHHKGNMEEFEVTEPFFNKDEWNRILKAINTSYFKMDAKDLGQALTVSFLGGGVSALGTFLRELRPKVA